MEIKGYGQVAIDEAMKIYATYDGIREVSMDALMLENMEITFVVAEKQICAILLTEPAKIENIRVLLLDNDNMFRLMYHWYRMCRCIFIMEKRKLY